MADLTQFDQAYDDAETQDGGDFEQLPDGTYQVFVDEACVKETKQTQMPMLAWKLKVMSGPCEGRFLFKNSVITDKTISFIKTDLSLCGMRLDKFSDLPGHLHLLINMQLEVKAVTKKYINKKNEEVEGQNVWIQRQIKAGANGAVSEEDIPF